MTVRSALRDLGSSEPSAALLRLLAEAVPQLVWIADEHGVVTYYNDRVSLYAGISSGADGAWNWTMSLHPDDVEMTIEAWTESVTSGSPYECEHRVHMADASYRWHISRALKVSTELGLTWFGSSTDIHDMKVVSQKLGESEDRFRTIADSAPVMIWVADRHASCTYLSERWYEFTGQDRGSGLDQTWIDAVHPDDRPRVRDVLRQALDLQESFELEYRLRRHDGDYRWVLDAATPRGEPGRNFLGFTGSILDITDRKQLELALQTSEQRFRSLADNLPLLIWAHDATGAFEFGNATYEEYFGVAPQTVVGSGWKSLTHPDDGHVYATEFAACVREQRAFRGVVRVRRADGEWRSLQSWAEPQFDPDGVFLGHIGASADITERVRTEEDLRRLHREEHRLAIRLQRALLPGAPIEVPGYEIVARYLPATDRLEVGGDWYETFRLKDGRIGVAVGDVVGHGAPAAIAMGQLRSAFLALAAHAREPGELLGMVDEFARVNTVTDFATACCLLIDPRTGRAVHASAGHPPMLMVPLEGPSYWLDGALSPPLGISPTDGERPNGTVIMEPGSLLVAYSDGLVERRDRPIDQGMEQLRTLLEANRHRSADTLCELALDEMAAGTGFGDDTVIVCVRRAASG